jgi:hypothetical protein
VLVGLVAALVGAIIVLAAFDRGPMSDAPMHAPAWIVALAGGFFATCGFLLAAPPGRAGVVFGGVATISLTIVFAWTALYGDARYFSGGLPFVSRHTNVVIARIMFALVALLGLAITANAFRRSTRDRD